MAESVTITIRRQVLDVDVRSGEADGVALQRRLPRLCAEVLGPAIESALAPYDPGEAHLVIDRLEIDLSVAPDRLDTDLAEGVRHELAEWLRRHAPAGPVGPETDSSGGSGTGPGNTDPGAGAGGPPADGGVLRRSGAETLDEALAVFLATGALPWWFDVPAGTSLERLVLDSWATDGAPPGPSPGMRARLAEVLRAPVARARLVLQFSAGVTAAVVRALAPAVADTVEQVLPVLDRLPRPDPVAPDAWQAAREHLVRRLGEVALGAAVAGEAPGPAVLLARARTSSPTAPSPSTGPAARELAAALEQRWPGGTEATTVAAEELPRTAVEASEATGWGQDEGGILVDNAGLVLLHPFLPRFLQGLGVAREGQMLDPARALVLLHHLATGERTAPEHRLTLAKLLCGVPAAQPVPADVGLTDAETAEATALLQAMIRHWQVLRDTSPDALRAEFLTRPGLLSTTADGDRLLRVEARSVDVLLDQLPWGLSLVGLPWMAGLLQVEWR